MSLIHFKENLTIRGGETNRPGALLFHKTSMVVCPVTPTDGASSML